jgi:hypothetical protein
MKPTYTRTPGDFERPPMNRRLVSPTVQVMNSTCLPR